MTGFYFSDLAEHIGHDSAMRVLKAFGWTIGDRVMSAEEVWCALTFHYHKVGTTKATGAARPRRSRKGMFAKEEVPGPNKRTDSAPTGHRTSTRGAERLLQIQRERAIRRKAPRVFRKKQTPSST